jgi:hypothetical protein
LNLMPLVSWVIRRSSTAQTSDRQLSSPGTQVVLEVVNEGDEVHDLALEGGARTRRLDPGQSHGSTSA